MERLTAKQAQSMMEAVAAVYEKKEDCVDKDKKTKHNCAKKVCHKEHGEGACIPGKHTLLEDGTVTHYSVVFEHGVEEMIPVEDLEVLVTEMHEHAEMEGEDLQEVDLGKLYNTVVKSVGSVGSKAAGAAGARGTGGTGGGGGLWGNGGTAGNPGNPGTPSGKSGGGGGGGGGRGRIEYPAGVTTSSSGSNPGNAGSAGNAPRGGRLY